jgi:hypothetical protein
MFTLGIRSGVREWISRKLIVAWHIRRVKRLFGRRTSVEVRKRRDGGSRIYYQGVAEGETMFSPFHVIVVFKFEFLSHS